MANHKIYINAPVDYIEGYLRYGHYEGKVILTDEEFERFKENPIEAFHDLKLRDSLCLEVDDWKIYDVGDVNDIEWDEV